MRMIRMAGLASCAVLMLGATFASSAFAGLFDASKEGKLKGKALSTQVFTTKAGKVECTKLSVEGNVTKLVSETQVVTVKYESCTAFGFVAATISPAEYLFMANETVDLKKAVTMTAVGCEVTIPAQNGLATVKYANVGANMEIKPNVTGVESEGKGTTCTYAKEKAGTYTGNSEVELEGGKIEWHAVADKWSVGQVGGKPIWLINGAELKAGEKRIAESPAGGFSFFVGVEGTQLEILCNDATARVEFIGGVPGTDTDSMKFTECKVVKPAACTLKEPSFSFASSTELAIAAEKFYDVFFGDAGDKIVVEGAECFLKGTLSLAGAFYGEVVGETIKFVEERGTLEVVRVNEGKEFKYPAVVKDGSGMELKL